TVIAGEVLFPLAQARDVMKFYADYAAEAPDDLYVDLGLKSKPGGEDAVAMIQVCYSGPDKNADKLLEPIRKAGTTLADGIKAIDYVAEQRREDQTDPRATGNYTKAGFITGISDDLIEAVLSGFEPHPRRKTSAHFQHAGGAIGRVAADASAFAHRYATHDFFVSIAWPAHDSRDPHVRFIKDYWSTLEPFTRGFYVNSLMDQKQNVVNENYQGNYARLVKIKNKYDPGNLFRLNANVIPTV
ncbi:MAG: BBE domain-containing protein, partial [Woeseiaceae bacterium]